MPANTTEHALESHIAGYLVAANHYLLRHHTNYNRTECIDEDLLFGFLEATQPQETAKLQAIHGPLYRQKISYRINQKIKDQTVVAGRPLGGIIEALRTGITESNIKLRLFYDQPVSTLNEAAAALYEQNIFSITRQLHYSTQHNNSLDAALFINGLPVITLEFKNELTKQNVKDAIDQYKRNRDLREELFHLGRCMVHFAVDTDQVWMCTQLKGEASYFLPFNKGHESGAGNPPNPAGIKTDYLWKEVLTKDSLTNIIQNYVQLVEEEEEKVQPDGLFKKEKVRKLLFPRYHQLLAVRLLLAHSYRHGPGQRYLIQHSAGSGKSNSISWLAHQLVGLHGANGIDVIFDSIIVVTDRRVLDQQIRKNIRQFELTKGVVEAITEGSRQLKEALEAGKKIIITTIQKFPYIVDEIGELPGKKFALIIDEAHSSQSGNASGMMNTVLEDDVPYDTESGEVYSGEDRIVAAIKGRKMLPNASYYAFTATPKNKTLELFGEKYMEEGKEKIRPFNVYSMKQAIEEKFILDVLQNYVTYKSYYSLLKKITDDPKYDKEKARKKLRVFVESHDHAIEKKTAIMVTHFLDEVIRKRKIKGLAKAMVVSGSRRNAVKYKRAFDQYLAAIGSPYKAIVAFSGDIDGDTEASLNGFGSGDIPDQFKQSQYRFLIVANKYQTGFDQPLLHTMYVDKKLGSVNAVQTLSRLNRTMQGKEDTFVLDFANDADEIKKAFDPFYKTTILGGATDPNKLFDLQNALDAYQVYTPKQITLFTERLLDRAPVDQLHILLDEAAATFRSDLNEEAQEDFRAKCKSYVRLYAFLSQIVAFINPYLEQLYQFLKHLQNKLGREKDDDLTQEILDNIDMDSYRLQKQGEQQIKLEQGEELMPVQPEMGGGKSGTEYDQLSNILKTFNDRFGTQFKDEDKVRKMTQQLMEDVAADQEFVDSFNHSDTQNARITFDKVLAEKLVSHIASNFEFYKKYNDDPEFKDFFAGSLFRVMVSAINSKPI